MQRVISFDKNLEFKTMIGEITSISLEPQLAFTDESTISGELIISGKYKLTSASRLEEDFIFHLPVEVILTERLESNDRNVSIDDFRYEIEADDILSCHISILVQGVEIVDIIDDSKEEISSLTDDDIKQAELINEECRNLQLNSLDNHDDEDDFEQTKSEEIKKIESEAKENNNHNVGLFSSFDDSDETFASYSVYIYRQNDTIEMIMDKYQVTREELENYNDLSNLLIGSKIIIPTHSNE